MLNSSNAAGNQKKKLKIERLKTKKEIYNFRPEDYSSEVVNPKS